MNRTKSTGRIAPASTLSAADKAAHDAASYRRKPARGNFTACPDCNRPVDGAHQCNPRADWLSPAGRAALQRLAVATGTDSDPNMDESLRRVRDHGAAIRDGLAEYRAWAGDAA